MSESLLRYLREHPEESSRIRKAKRTPDTAAKTQNNRPQRPQKQKANRHREHPSDKARDMIALNAGACIYVAGVASTLADGIALAQDLIATGQANEKLKSFVDFTQLMRGHKS